LLLAGTVEPADAAHKAIVWSVQNAGTTGAVINGNTLSAAAAGTAVIRASIADGMAVGTAFTKNFTITVNAASTPTPTPELVQITHTRQGALQYDYPTVLPGGNNRTHFTAAVLDMLPEARLLIFGGNTWYDVSGVTLSEAVAQNRIGTPVEDYQAVLENGAVTSPAAAEIIRRINRAYPLTAEKLQPIYAAYLALSDAEQAAVATDEAVRDMLAVMG
jgi:hypothetical protein